MSTDLKEKEIKEEKSPLAEGLFKVGAHIAYTRSRRHPSVKEFIFGKKQKNDVFDLAETEKNLERAKEFIQAEVQKGHTILFVGTKPEAQAIIEKYAKEVKMPYVTFRWIGGLFTNFSEMKKRLARLTELSEQKKREDFSKYTKKEQARFNKELENLLKKFGGVEGLSGIPHVLFVIDSLHEDIAVTEAKMMKIPVVALCNSDCDITKIDYPILGNDSSPGSISYFVKEIAEAIGKK
jgi:small subunit ribosomal protein S2